MRVDVLVIHMYNTSDCSEISDAHGCTKAAKATKSICKTTATETNYPRYTKDATRAHYDESTLRREQYEQEFSEIANNEQTRGNCRPPMFRDSAWISESSNGRRLT